MPPKKSSTPRKAAKAPASKPAASEEISQNHTRGVIPPRAVQPTTNTTNMSTEQHNSPAISEEAVRQRAYELYEQRGKRAGRHHEDWFRAEQEIRERHRRNP